MDAGTGRDDFKLPAQTVFPASSQEALADGSCQA